MKLSWFLVILLLVLVATFSVQNADVITVHFLPWKITMSAALVIQLAALLGGVVGLFVGFWSRPPRKSAPASTTFGAPTDLPGNSGPDSPPSRSL